MQLKLRSRLMCPLCGYRYERTMPQDACLFYEECPRCRNVYRPKPGDCCVFCSYGSVPCPPKQKDRLPNDGEPLFR